MEQIKNSKLKYLITFFIITSAFILIYNFVLPYFNNNLKNLNSNNNYNIILITIDTLRADHLGCYGYQRNTSPNIDVFAKNSYIFKKTISQKPKTTPGMFSIFTGQPPFIVNNGDSIYQFNNTLTQILKKSNYLTIGLSSTNMLNRYSGFERGFDIFHDNLDLDTYTDPGTVKASIIVNKTIEILENKKNNKIFLWTHFKDPHTKYFPPKDYGLLFHSNETILIDKINQGYFEGIGGIPKFALLNNSRNLNYYISQYDSEIKYLDDELGKLFKFLKEKSMYDNSYIIITADHGEGLGEDNYYFEHGALINDANIWVPLIIKTPYQKQQKIISETTILSDVYEFIISFLYEDSSFLYKIDESRIIPLTNIPESKTNIKYYGIVYNKSKIIYNQNNKTYTNYDNTTLPKSKINELFNSIINKIESYDIEENHQMNDEISKKLKSLGYIN